MLEVAVSKPVLDVREGSLLRESFRGSENSRAAS